VYLKNRAGRNFCDRLGEGGVFMKGKNFLRGDRIAEDFRRIKYPEECWLLGGDILVFFAA